MNENVKIFIGLLVPAATIVEHHGREAIEFVVDISPHKQGRYMPGVHLPILPLEALHERRPNCLLLLAWNFAEEIMTQQAGYRDAGGRFLIPVPEPRFA